MKNPLSSLLGLFKPKTRTQHHMQQNYIVSANYLDRGSPNKWLARAAGVEPEKAQPHKELRLTNVTFGASSASERGFGCSVVAKCEAVEYDPAPKAMNTKGMHELRFSWDRFCDLVSGKEVTSSPLIILDSTGRVFAQV